MKTIEIVGSNYSGVWKKTRIACRGVILQDNNLLLSYETRNNRWMIPGGGIEKDETDEECCRREVAEETGYLTEIRECALEIHEYYGSVRYISRYYLCSVVGKTTPHLTAPEIEAGMEARWMPVEEIVEIFSRYADYEKMNELRGGMYLREFSALRALREIRNNIPICGSG